MIYEVNNFFHIRILRFKMNNDVVMEPSAKGISNTYVVSYEFLYCNIDAVVVLGMEMEMEMGSV